MQRFSTTLSQADIVILLFSSTHLTLNLISKISDKPVGSLGSRIISRVRGVCFALLSKWTC